MYDDLKLGQKYRYIVYALSKDLKKIVVDCTGEKDKTYDDFVGKLIEAADNGECRYGVFDAEYRLKDNQQRKKPIFFFWNPDSASVKQKMLYSSSKDYLKKALKGLSKDIQANDTGDLEWGGISDMLIKAESAS